ncbi:hypothetical protein EV659_11120 [Rhodothalassium salexigens DSM 2132]|uniref:Glutamine amidotransferase n=1 Tax=Rhodothalassium salexigens DSM 2132 TaxID=1188247 RepID=A0A4R2P967_RHOSA|nr:hypothetical protein [Rhodothalassium salexigens]MBB4212508.1 hypothetical protein [Rhodothalassium salexigens DSM 2132]MBK1638477.1 hypothetical protein [Rhodothalassium salexigens DSM 2132]TCP31452.1 hypothetical protein EV659_11120 [Rhodothalassium salexigens DSM 2132]
MDAADIAFDPLLPLWALALLGAAALAPALISLAARARGGLARLTLGLAVVALLAGPMLVQERRESLPRHVLIASDRSESMTLGQRRAQADAAAARLNAALDDAGDLIVHRVDIPQAADGTRLFGPLARALKEVPADRLAGVVAITDGQIHDTPEPLAALDAPFHALVAGAPGFTDRRIDLVTAPRYALVDKRTPLTVRIEEDNLATQGAVSVSVRVDGERRPGLRGRVGQDLTVPVRPERRGETLVEIAVEPAPGETFLGNNRVILKLNAVRDRLKVLLISGEPHVGERVWRQALKADPAVDLVHFTILRLPDSRDLTPESELSLIPFPTQRLFERQLDDFDLVIFDRYSRRAVLERQHLFNLVEFVETGGAILISTGPEFAEASSLFRTPLRPILPAAPTGQMLAEAYRPTVTDLGARHPVTAPLAADQDRWGRWFRVMEAAVLGGDVLMEGPAARPLLVLSRVGEGRIAQILSDQIWLWARGVEGGGPDQQLLRRTAHWLMKEPDLEEEALSAQALAGQRIEIHRRSLGQAAGTVTVSGPLRAADTGVDQAVSLRETAPGQAVGVTEVPRRGLYRVRDGEREALVAVGLDSAAEYAALKPSATALTPLAERTGGGVFWLAEAIPEVRRVGARDRRAGPGWLGLTRERAERVVAVEQRPLLPAWAWLVLVGGLLVGVWMRESR